MLKSDNNDKKRKKKKEAGVYRINFEKGVDPQWQKVDRGVYSVAEGGGLDFGGNGVLRISACYASNC